MEYQHIVAALSCAEIVGVVVLLLIAVVVVVWLYQKVQRLFRYLRG